MQTGTQHLIAVGIPVFNGEQWLEESLDSILSQTFPDFEVFIADNASTDRTREICLRYANADPRVRYHRHPRNLGALRNYNAVFEETHSQYFKWASCSDICKPHLLERCLEVLETREDVVLAYAKTMLFSTMGDVKQRYYQNLNLEYDSPSHRFAVAADWLEGLNNAYNGVWRRSAMESLMPYRESRGYDINFMLEMALRGKFVEVPEVLFHRRYETQSTGDLLAKSEQVSFFGADKVRYGRRERLARQLHRFTIPFRAPISPAEKLRVGVELLARLSWLGPALWRNVRSLARRVVNKLASLE
ncbi:MAG: glycosyltransferase family 2 protein [Pseudomonadota bacterium]